MFLFLVQIQQLLQKFYMLQHGFVENFVRKLIIEEEEEEISFIYLFIFILKTFKRTTKNS